MTQLRLLLQAAHLCGLPFYQTAGGLWLHS